MLQQRLWPSGAAEYIMNPSVPIGSAPKAEPRFAGPRPPFPPCHEPTTNCRGISFGACAQTIGMEQEGIRKNSSGIHIGSPALNALCIWNILCTVRPVGFHIGLRVHHVYFISVLFVVCVLGGLHSR